MSTCSMFGSWLLPCFVIIYFFNSFLFVNRKHYYAYPSFSFLYCVSRLPIGAIYLNINISIVEKLQFFCFSHANLAKYTKQSLYALKDFNFQFPNSFLCIFSCLRRIWYPFCSILKATVSIAKHKCANLWRCILL